MTCFKVQTYNNISEKGLGLFEPESFALGQEFDQPDAYIMRSHKLHGEVLPGSLLAIARAGAGTNNIPIEQCTEQGVVVFNTPGANANAVKELVAASLFMGSRDIFGGLSFVQTLNDVDDPAQMSKMLEAEKKRFAGSEVAGKTLGVVGLGAIGAMVANMALDLGMSVAGYDPAISVEAAWRLSSRVQKVEDLHALLRISDFVSLHIPANDHTRGLIDGEALATMKPGACLLNFAREEVVDTQALVTALGQGAPARYISDFPNPALLGQPGTVLMPHIGASTSEAEENCAMMAANQLIDFLNNGNIVNSVNFPQTRMGRNGGHRITFGNHNEPGVLGQVLSLLAAEQINVLDMVNKSRGNFAYNIIDIGTPLDTATWQAISSINGVMHLRNV